MLPGDINKENNAQYEEVTIPPTQAKPPRETDDFVQIQTLDEVHSVTTVHSILFSLILLLL